MKTSFLDKQKQATTDNYQLNRYADQDIFKQDLAPSEHVYAKLTSQEQLAAQQLAEEIQETDFNGLLTYGAEAQKELRDFSRSVLNQVQFQDTGEVSDVLTSLLGQLDDADPSQLTAPPSLFQKVFRRVKASLNETMMRYQEISRSIDKVAIKLEREQSVLVQDNQMLEDFYAKNKDYYDQLNLYIAAGELKLQEVRESTIPLAIEAAEKSENQMDIQAVNDLLQFAERLDKRVYDLRLSRQITIQQAPQIRLIQNTNQLLAEKIQVSIHTAIPLWENQITIALALLRQQNAVNSQRQVSETTNSLLRKNSEMLKQSAIDMSREASRGIIDIETVRHTHQNLIAAIEETLAIQSQSQATRRNVEGELVQMEEELKQTLLNFSAPSLPSSQS